MIESTIINRHSYRRRLLRRAINFGLAGREHEAETVTNELVALCMAWDTAGTERLLTALQCSGKRRP